MNRLPSGQNQSRQSPGWTDSKVDRAKGKHNPELTKPILDTSLYGQNVMWPDSQVDTIQVNKLEVDRLQRGQN